VRFSYAAVVAGHVTTALLATALFGVLLLGSACSDDAEEGSLITVEDVTAAFQEHGIELTAVGEPSEFGAALTPADSNQVQVVVYPSTREAMAIVLVRTGAKAQFEVAHGSDVLFTVRNLYVVYDTRGSDYAREAVRAAVLELG
jgi:hypothetical protein